MAERECNEGRAYRVVGDTRIAEVARRQSGVVSDNDLRAAHLDADSVRRREQAGRLHELFPGAWAVGHRAVTRDGWFLAATMSIGEDSGLGFYSAVQHHDLWDGKVGKVHVVVPRRVRHSGRIHIHSVQEAPDFDVVRGVPVVRPALAVLQFAAVVRDEKEIRRVAREAQFGGLATHEELLAVCADGVRGSRRLRLALRGGPAPTANGGEDAALELIRSCGLDPLVQAPLLGFVADFYLPEHGLVVEFDGRVHDIPIVREDDDARQAVFEAAGLRVMRLRWRDLTRRRDQTRARLLAATVTRGAHTAS